MLAVRILHTAEMEMNLIEIRRKVLQISEQRGEPGSLTLAYVSHAPFFVTVMTLDYVHSFILQGERNMGERESRGDTSERKHFSNPSSFRNHGLKTL